MELKNFILNKKQNHFLKKLYFSMKKITILHWENWTGLIDHSELLNYSTFYLSILKDKTGSNRSSPSKLKAEQNENLHNKNLNVFFEAC